MSNLSLSTRPQGPCSRLVLSLALLSCSSLYAVNAVAQNSNATITGTVTDQSGARIAHAQITILNEGTNVVVFKGFTDNSGAFVAPQVQTGSYRVTAEDPGMQRVVLNNVVASVSATVNANITMQVGSLAQDIVVEAGSEQLQKSSSDVSTLITPSQVENLPIQNRNVANLLVLIPGVVHGGSATSLNTDQLSFNGSRSNNTEVLLNGVSVIIATIGSVGILPSSDGLNEFRVLTSNAPAEFGRTSGAVVASETRQGTDTYHGALYFLARNEAFNANNFFNNLQGIARPRDRYFQFGGLIGGPVVIPRIYNGAGKTFFFANIDQTLQRVPRTVTLTVPSAAFRAGDFSSSAIPVYNPVTKMQFVGNRVTGIDPAAAAILARIPLPNRTGTPDPANSRFINNYVSTQITSTTAARDAFRVDEQISSKDRISSSVFYASSLIPNAVDYTDPALNTQADASKSTQWVASADYTRVWTPSLVSDVNFGFFRYVNKSNPTGQGIGASALFNIASLPTDALPFLSTTGYSSVGASQNILLNNVTNTFTPFGSVTKSLGKHSVKVGAQLRKNQFNSFNPAQYVNGSLSFTGTITDPKFVGGNAINSLADFELGKIKTGSYEIAQPETGRRNYNLGIFAEDDFKTTPKLTINAGIRWEYESPQVNTRNIYSRFDSTTGNLLIAGKNASSSLNLNTPKLDFSPRVGLAYSPNPNTVVRAAFGTFYGVLFSNLGGQINYPGYDVQTNFVNLGTGIAQPFSLSQGIPLIGVRDLNNPAAAYANASPSTPAAANVGTEYGKINPLSLVQQWSLGIQQALPLHLTLEVNYVGNHGLHLPITVPVNAVPMSQADAVARANTSLATQLSLPFPSITTFTVLANEGNSSYNGLQVSVKRQFNTRFVLLSNYTWAHSFDDDSGIFGGGVIAGSAHAQYSADPKIRRTDRSASAFDARNIFNLAIQYTTAGPRWARGLKMSPIFVGQTGIPINISQNTLFPGAQTQRPNGDVSQLRLPSRIVDGSVVRLYKQASSGNLPLTPSGPLFTGTGANRVQILPTALGSVRRNSARALGVATLDLSVAKNFPVFRRSTAELRVDAFNVLNHTNLGLPSSSLTAAVNSAGTPYFNSANFGAITSAQPARTLQITGRIQF